MFGALIGLNSNPPSRIATLCAFSGLLERRGPERPQPIDRGLTDLAGRLQHADRSSAIARRTSPCRPAAPAPCRSVHGSARAGVSWVSSRIGGMLASNNQVVVPFACRIRPALRSSPRSRSTRIAQGSNGHSAVHAAVHAHDLGVRAPVREQVPHHLVLELVRGHLRVRQRAENVPKVMIGRVLIRVRVRPSAET